MKRLTTSTPIVALLGSLLAVPTAGFACQWDVAGPTDASIVQLLAEGTEPFLVAELAGCPDVDALEQYIAAFSVPIGDEEFAQVSAGFNGAVIKGGAFTTRTSFDAELKPTSLRMMPSLGFWGSSVSGGSLPPGCTVGSLGVVCDSPVGAGFGFDFGGGFGFGADVGFGSGYGFGPGFASTFGLGPGRYDPFDLRSSRPPSADATSPGRPALDTRSLERERPAHDRVTERGHPKSRLDDFETLRARALRGSSPDGFGRARDTSSSRTRAPRQAPLPSRVPMERPSRSKSDYERP